METQDILNEIQEVNLSYLILAQKLLVDDYDTAIVRLGIIEDAAQVILKLSSAQLIKLASGSALVMGFNLNDAELLEALIKDNKLPGRALQQAKKAIFLAQKPLLESAKELKKPKKALV